MFLAFHRIVRIVVLVCWIMEVVTDFKKGDGPLMGILSIVCCCTIGGLVIGWINCKKWGIQNLMLVYTIAFVLNMILSGIAQKEMLEMFQMNGPP